MFGENVKAAINDFLGRYYETVFGIQDFEDKTDKEKAILMSLREYGINLNDQLISMPLVKEIECRLNSRYSMFDIVNVITAISKEDGEYKAICKSLLEKYVE